MAISNAKVAPLSQEEIGKSLTNPNPPTTEFEKKTVAFAEAVLYELIVGVVSGHPKPSLAQARINFQRSTIRLGATQKCMFASTCGANQTSQKVTDHANDFINTISLLTEVKNGHLIPWAYERYQNAALPLSNELQLNAEALMDSAVPAIPVPTLANDEFMVHFHVKNIHGVWYHLNVILSETAENELLFQRFFATPVPIYDIEMPQGVLC